MSVSSAYPISLCDFPSLELPLWPLTEESEKLAHLPHPHPSPCLFLFSQEPHFLLLNQYSVFALWEPGKHCSQPSQRVNSESIFFLLVSQMLIMASVGRLIVDFISWELCLWPPTAVLKVQNIFNIRTPVGIWVHFFFFFLETSLLDSSVLKPQSELVALQAHTATAHGASFQLSPLLDPCFLDLLPCVGGAHSPVVSGEKACGEGSWV